MATRVLDQRGMEAAPAHGEKTGLWSWITTVDHKRIGILYGVTAFAFFLIGGLEALLIRLQLAVPNNTLIHPETYNQLFTMHGTTMIFLVVMPLSTGLANYLVPLQIGARDVAFPRLNLFSWYLFGAGGSLTLFALLAGGVDTGWTFYPRSPNAPDPNNVPPPDS